MRQSTRRVSVQFVLALLALILSADFSVHAQQALHQIDLGLDLFDVDWSLDGQYLAVGSSNGVRVYSSSLQEIAILQGHTGNVTSVSWNNDGTLLASSGGRDDKTVRIWQFDQVANTFNQIQILPIEVSMVFLVDWSPDGTKLASLSSSDSILARSDRVVDTIDIWDTQTWTKLNQGYIPFFEAERALTWSIDSNKIAVVGEYGVAVIPLTSSGTGFLSDYTGTYDTEIASADWSPSNQIAAGGQALLLLDGTSGQVINRWDISSYMVRWNPSGNILAIHSSNNSITLFEVSTGTNISEFTIPSRLKEIDWASSTDRLAVISSDGIIQVWDVSDLTIPIGTPTVTPQFTLTPSLTLAPTSTFTSTRTPIPFVNKLVFSSQVSGNSPQLYTVNLDGTGLTTILNISGESVSPSWSLDGQRIVYANRATENDPFQLRTIQTDGTNGVQILPTVGSNTDPSWSPDGRLLVYTSDQSGNREIYITTSDGTATGFRQLTVDAAADYQPDWSPNPNGNPTTQRAVVFISERNSSDNAEIYLMNLGGGGLTRLTTTPMVRESYPRWSPDGQRIAYIATVNGQSRLNVMNADGTGMMELISVNDVPFDWSPDGSQIVFIAPENTINVFDFANSYNAVVFSDTNPKFGVSWSYGQSNIIITPTITPTPTSTFTPLPCNTTPADTASLISAVAAGNALSSPYVICLIPNLTYTLTTPTANSQVDLAPAGLFVLFGDIIIRGNNATIERAPRRPRYANLYRERGIPAT